jgi:pyrroline-5-carboxylate reductase
MAAAIARGWAASGPEGPAAMVFCDIDGERARRVAAEVGGEARPTLRELRAASDVLVLAVKPAALAEVASELDGEAPAILSVLAVTPRERVRESFPGAPVLRAMPNQPVEVRRGVICHPPADGVPAELAARLLALLDLLGDRVELDEGVLDAAMAVMSCSPAYVALFAEALAAAGVREGLEATVARELVTGAIAGTGELLGRRDPEAIRRAVAPAGGATDAGLRALEAAGFEGAVGAAVDGSLERFR